MMQVAANYLVIYALSHGGLLSSLGPGILAVVRCVPKNVIPFEIKRQCRAFEFECFNSLMNTRMRNSLLSEIFYAYIAS